MSIIEPISPGGVVDFGGGPITVVGTPGGGGAGDGLWTVLAQLLLDSGPEYLAVRDIELAGRSYDGRVLRWGRVEKSIAALTGMPQTGDALFRIADTDYRWRDLAYAQTLRGRTIRLKFVRADLTADAFQPFFTGEVVKLSSGPGYIEVTARDMSWGWMDEEMSPLLTSANYPYILPESDGAFAKIVIGSVNTDSVAGAAVSSDQQGAIELQHIGTIGAVDRFGAFRHTLFDIALYRRTSAGGAAFFPVDPGEYNVTVENLSIDGFIYEMTFVDFLAVQESGATIRADVDGLYFRPAFGDYPAVGFDPVLNPGGAPGVLANPIDGFLNFMRLECRKATLFDNDGIMAIRTKFSNVPFVGGGSGAYQCAGVIMEPETPRSVLGRFLPCFNLDMFHNRHGQIALSFTDTSPAARPFFSDNRADGARQLILRESFFEEDPSPVANRCLLPAYRHYAAGVWLWTGVYDNFADQAALSVPRRNYDDSLVYSGGDLVRDPRIEPLTSEVWFSRDFTTIYDVAVRRMSFASLGSYQQYFDLPTPEIIEEVELARRVLVTHRAGRAAGGYRQQELKIIAESFDLASFRTTLTTIRAVPGTILVSGVVVTGSVTISAESELSVATTEPYELIDSVSAGSSDGHTVSTSPMDTTGADLIIVAVADYNASGGSIVTDNNGNTWSRLPPNMVANGDGSDEEVQLWFSQPTTVGAGHTFTATESIGGSSSYPAIAVAALKFSKPATPYDTETGAYSNSPTFPTIATGVINPAEDGELIVTAVAWSSTDAFIAFSINGGFSAIESVPKNTMNFGLSLAVLIQTTATAVNPTWDSGIGTGYGMSTTIVAFKGA